MSKESPGVRYAEIDRETKETRIHAVLDFDGGTRRDISTGVRFFDHMLQLMAFHGQFDVGIQAEGDIDVDDHHTVEDVGIVLGKAIRQALEQTDGLTRYGSTHTAMDEALVLVAIDLSGRGGFYPDLRFRNEKIGALTTQNVFEFFRALCLHGGITLHIRQLAGENDHHICEAVFKGFGQALRLAATRTERRGPSSTKGRLD